jgi:hypothetical protein
LIWDTQAIIAASDGSTDAVYFVNLYKNELAHTIQFEDDAWPSRMATSDERLYVILRGSGELVEIDPGGSISRRVAACAAPRGVAVDTSREMIWVSCASSELVGFSLDTLEREKTFHVAPDLRDVVANEKGLFVARFRTAQVLKIDPDDGAISRSMTMRATSVAVGYFAKDMVNSLWRMTQNSEGDLLVSYQQSVPSPLELLIPPTPDPIVVEQPTVYYFANQNENNCTPGLVQSVQSKIRVLATGDMEREPPRCMNQSALPIDIDEDTCGKGHVLSGAVQLPESPPNNPIPNRRNGSPCIKTLSVSDEHIRLAAVTDSEYESQIILARGSDLYLRVSASRHPDLEIILREENPMHPGQRMFHTDTGIGLACASCHPEGGDDGHVWRFATLRKDGSVESIQERRTQNLRGGIQGKLHWDGEFEDMDELMDEIFVSRMRGRFTTAKASEFMRHWLDLQAPEPGITLTPQRRDLRVRGEEVFSQAGCAECHVGEMLTDYQFHDVGTGGMRKTPTLRGVASRALLMSDGCASTLEKRFEPGCGGGDEHGTTSNLSEEDKDALVAYLETL